MCGIGRTGKTAPEDKGALPPPTPAWLPLVESDWKIEDTKMGSLARPENPQVGSDLLTLPFHCVAFSPDHLFHFVLPGIILMEWGALPWAVWGCSNTLSFGISERLRTLGWASRGQTTHNSLCMGRAGGGSVYEMEGGTLKKGRLVCALTTALGVPHGGTGRGAFRGPVPRGWMGKEKEPRPQGQKSVNRKES